MDIFKKTAGDDFDVLNGAQGKLLEGLESLLRDADLTKGSDFASAFYSCTLLEGLVSYLNERLNQDFDSVKEKYSRVLFPGAGIDSVACIPKLEKTPKIAIPVDVPDILKTYEKEETLKWKTTVASMGQQSSSGNSLFSVVGPGEHQMVFALLDRNCLIKLSSFLDVDNPDNPNELRRYKNGSPEKQVKQIWIYEKGGQHADPVYGECFPNWEQCPIQKDLLFIKNYKARDLNKWKAIDALVRLFSRLPKRKTTDDFSGIYASGKRSERDAYCHNHILAVTEIDRYSPQKGRKNGKNNRWSSHGDLALLIEFVQSID